MKGWVRLLLAHGVRRGRFSFAKDANLWNNGDGYPTDPCAVSALPEEIR